MVAGIRFVEMGITRIVFDFFFCKFSLYNNTTQRQSLTGSVFTRAVHHHVDAKLNRIAQYRRGDGIVHNRDDIVFVGYFNDSLEIWYIDAWVGDGFEKDQFRSLINQLFDLFRS